MTKASESAPARCAPGRARRWLKVVILAALAVLIGVGLIVKPDRLVMRFGLTYEMINGDGDRKLSRRLLDESLALGERYMVANQKDAGNFTYEYDWRTERVLPYDGQVRQAGALWGLTLIYAESGKPETVAAIERGLAFFHKHTIRRKDGARFVAYPDDGTGKLGTTALATLAHIDYLRARPRDMPLKHLGKLKSYLDGYLKMLVSSRTSDGRWHAKYDERTGAPFGKPSSYFDGEALLALTKAARYLGRSELIPTVLAAADAGYELNIRRALAADADSNTTKGYYQWSSMAFFEIGTSGWPGTEKYRAHVVQLADWMIHEHETLRRNHNTAYAYEGIVHAYEIARLQGDHRRVEKFGTVIDIGLHQLTGWQVGHSLANGLWMKTARAKTRAHGGVQNSWANPVLRIDVVQHQMHAVVLARRYVYRGP